VYCAYQKSFGVPKKVAGHTIAVTITIHMHMLSEGTMASIMSAIKTMKAMPYPINVLMTQAKHNFLKYPNGLLDYHSFIIQRK